MLVQNNFAVDQPSRNGRSQTSNLIGLTALLLGLASPGFAQVIDNTASFRTVDADRFVRVHYEDDFFTGTDRYYSQGINLEYVDPTFNKFFLHRLLVKGKDARQMGIAIEHNLFTPSNINSDSILYGDRPYASTLTGRVFSSSYLEGTCARITSSFSFGVIGPAAGGKAMQSVFNQWSDDNQPKGWEHQNQNSLVLNYKVGMECKIFQIQDRLLFSGFSSAQLGTLNAKLSSGMVLIVGKLNSRLTAPHGGRSTNKQFTFHGYAQPMINFIGYDATLQGGMFNNDSPYTLSASDIKRVTLQANVGLVMQAGPIYMEYFVTLLSQEFSGGLRHSYGGVRVGVRW